MRKPSRACCHTLGALCERWSFEARELERKAALPMGSKSARAAAGAYRTCARDLQTVLAEYADDPETEPPGAA